MSLPPLVHVVLPAGWDDPRRPSGGNRYDQQLCAGLAEAGWEVRVATAPAPAMPGDQTLERVLARIPDGSRVLIDGLLASPAADQLCTQLPRLNATVLLHMPLVNAYGYEDNAAARASEAAVLAAADSVVVTSEWARRQVLAAYGLAPERVYVARPGVDPAQLPVGSRAAHPYGNPRQPALLLCVGVLAPHKGQDVLIDALARLDSQRPDPRHAAFGLRDSSRSHSSRLNSQRVDSEPGVTGVGQSAPEFPELVEGPAACASTSSAILGMGSAILGVGSAIFGWAGSSPAPGWRCVLVGADDVDPAYAADLRDRVRRAGLTERVRFAGALDRAAVRQAYAAADLLVVPSRAETYGMVVTEALASGVPVLASDVGGLPEALGRGSDDTLPGMLVRPGDPDALAAALSRWCRDPSHRAALRNAVRDRIATLPTWTQTVAAVAAALTVGDAGLIGTAGDGAVAGTAGDAAVIGTAGDGAVAETAGDAAVIGTAGDAAVAW